MIQIEANVTSTLSKVWNAWTKPEHITNWNFAADDWHCPKAENDLRNGGKFSSTMAAKDGSFGFDFWGTHTAINPLKSIKSVMGDGRKMKVTFEQNGDTVKILEEFEPETENTIDLQRTGWQAILNNFKNYVESL